MPLKLFNTSTRKKEIFRPISKKEVGIYSCGLTVYDYGHIGNFRAFLTADILRRYFEYKGFRVKQVMNFTDVDDKTIKGSQKEGTTLDEFTVKYKKIFFEDLETLNIEKAEYYPEATKHIREMVELVKALLKKGHAYKGEDGSVYYDISTFKDYGKFAHIKVEELKAGARVKQDEYAKEEASDFVLWKAWDEHDGNVYWQTELGKGRPGWHLECSAMSMKYLGKTFDIHTGGIDLVFPHHQNEIAQSEGSTGKKFVNYWLHNEWLLVEGKKMSKSLGNFYTLRDVISKGYKPKAIRYLLISNHYRQQLNFTFDELKAAESTVEKFRDFVLSLKDHKEVKKESSKKAKNLIKRAKTEFESAMDDDLNISVALASLFDFMREINILLANREISEKDAKDALDFIFSADKVLGIMEEKEEALPSAVKKLIDERETARKNKNWAEADRIRAELLKKGIQLMDTPEGVRWKKI
ncbi:cysteine--tRNA ligase [Candidatus Woesearchaeota archaeon]|nr:cysteine--tRNA ligase [Candidatus Woesearchaeota archaeon]